MQGALFFSSFCWGGAPSAWEGRQGSTRSQDLDGKAGWPSAGFASRLHTVSFMCVYVPCIGGSPLPSTVGWLYSVLFIVACSLVLDCCLRFALLVAALGVPLVLRSGG